METQNTTAAFPNQLQVFDEDRLHDNISKLVNSYLKEHGNPPIFRTDSNQQFTIDSKGDTVKSTLFDIFINHLPQDQKSQYTCHCCSDFIKKVGSLAVIDPNTGLMKSLLWNENNFDSKFFDSFRKMRLIVESSNIIDVFQSNELSFGNQFSGGFAHMCLKLEQAVRKTHDPKGPGHAMSQSRQDYKILKQSLEAVDIDSVKLAVTLFSTHKSLAGLYPSFIKRLEAFSECVKQHRAIKDERIKNYVIWSTVARVTPDLIHFKNTGLGKFISDLTTIKTDGGDIEQTIKMFIAITKPEVYMRPTEPPKQGTVANAEKIIAEHNLEKSFDRCFVGMNDFKDFIWKPTDTKKAAIEKTGFFANLKTKEETQTVENKPKISGGVMTWVKFSNTLLKEAKKIFLNVPLGYVNNWTGILTAVHKDCTPILKWDKLEERNHMSSFGIVNGSDSFHWGINIGAAVEVSGIIKNLYTSQVLQFPEDAFKDSSVTLLTQNAKFVGRTGLGLFPEIVRRELYEIRSVIEAYSNSREPQDIADVVVSGYSMGPGYQGFSLVVVTDDAEVSILIDRFE